MQTRKKPPVYPETWVIGAVFLIVFCHLGLLAIKIAPVFKGIEAYLPFATGLSLLYGPVMFPAAGFVAAGALMVCDILQLKRWIWTAFVTAFAIAAVYGFQTFLVSGCFMSSTHPR